MIDLAPPPPDGAAAEGVPRPSPSLRVAIVPERSGRVLSPCASIRLQPFFDAMVPADGMQVRYLLPSELRRFAPQVLVWHRVSLTGLDIDLVEQLRRDCGTRLIFDLDDNLLDLEGHGERASYEVMIESVRRSMAMADEVWTSTSRLAARAARETSATISVLPNALDPQLWARPSTAPAPVARARGPLRLLYMGTRTHDADLALLEQGLVKLHGERPGSFELSVVGVRAFAGGLPSWLKTLDPPAHVSGSYPAFVAWFTRLSGFDLGVAPLLSSDFNDCKSPIKVLDYAAIGLPTLASAVPAYTDSLRSGWDCLHVENEAEAWFRAVGALAVDRSPLASVAAAARRLVAPDVFANGVLLRRNRLLETARVR